MRGSGAGDGWQDATSSATPARSTRRCIADMSVSMTGRCQRVDSRSESTRNKQTTTPKGRTRRTIPMTSTMHDALKRMSVIREGFVVRNLDGTHKTDDQADKAIQRICRKAGLPVRHWHTLRHAFGTHAALFGVNPWRLQAWLGHKRIDETMLYVHVAEAHHRELPEIVRAKSREVDDPDQRVLAMLGARVEVTEVRGSGVAVAA
jgi:hypothetical protein